MKPKNHKQLFTRLLERFSHFRANRKGQNVVEYLLIFATVVGTVLAALGPNGFVSKGIETVPETTLENARCIALRTCFSESGECNPVCPNDCCEPGENHDNCPQDCPLPSEEEPAYCGNGKRDTGETCRNCPQDFYPIGCCGDGVCDIDLGEEETCPSDCNDPGIVTCPDDVCDPETEDHESCPQDCPLPPPICGEDQMECNGECVDDESVENGGECCDNLNCDSGICIDGICRAPGRCLGSFDNASICLESSLPDIDTSSRLVGECTGDPCEFRCGEDYNHCDGTCYRNGTIEDDESCCDDANCLSGNCIDGICVPTPGGCIGLIPRDARPCDEGEIPTSTTANKIVPECTEGDCEYICESRFSFCHEYGYCVKDWTIDDGNACCDDVNCESGKCDSSEKVCVPAGAECGNGTVEDGEVCDGTDGLRSVGSGYWEGTNWYTEQGGDCLENCRGRFRSGSCGGKPENAFWHPNHSFVEFCNNGSGTECNNWRVVEDSAGNPISNDTTPMYSEEDIKSRTCDYFCGGGTEYCQKNCIDVGTLGFGSPCCQNSNCASNQCGENEYGDRVCLDPIPVCIGTPPANAEICSGDDSPETNLDVVLVPNCTARDCEYKCSGGAQYCEISGGKCILDESLPVGGACCSDANCASNDCYNNSCQPDTRCDICGTYYEVGQVMYSKEECGGTPTYPQPMLFTYECGSDIPVSTQSLGSSRMDLCSGMEGDSDTPTNRTFIWEEHRIEVSYDTDINDACPATSENCGNGTVDDGETCDDGNNRSSDGCNSSCQWETETFFCRPVIENAEFNNAESYVRTCTASNKTTCTSWDLPEDFITEYNPESSSTDCRFDCKEGMFWNGSVCQEEEIETAFCSDGETEGTEQCDDGNKTNGDGCNHLCEWETKNFICSSPGVANAQMNDRGAYSQRCIDSNGSECTEWYPPDDPVTEYNETTSSTSCQFICRSGTEWTGSECKTIVTCGDGTTIPGEQCDDGNTNNGDGCDASCNWETRIVNCPALKDETSMMYNTAASYVQTCFDSNGTTCTSWDPPEDSTLEYNERASNESCQFICKSNYVYEGGECKPLIVCGDNDVEGDEKCDDGNTNSGDGCSSNCQWESKNFNCPTPPGGSSTKMNTVFAYSQICNDSNGTHCTSWNPPDDPNNEYNEEASSTSCRHICNDGYTREGSECVSNSCGNGMIDPVGCTETCGFSGNDSSCNSISKADVCNAMANCQWNVDTIRTDDYCEGLGNPLDCLNEPYEKCTWDENHNRCLADSLAGFSFETNGCGYIVQCDLVQSEDECIGSSACKWDDCTEECDGGANCSNCSCDAGYEPTSPPGRSCTNVCSTARNQWGQCCPSGRPLVTDCNGNKVCMPCSQPGETWTGDCGSIGPLSGMPGCKTLLN